MANTFQVLLSATTGHNLTVTANSLMLGYNSADHNVQFSDGTSIYTLTFPGAQGDIPVATAAGTLGLVSANSTATQKMLTMTSGVGAWSTIPASGTGTVTSVGVGTPAFMTATGGPVTGSGTITLAFNNQNAGLVFAGPATGTAGPVTFTSTVGGLTFAAAPTLSTITLGSVLFAGTAGIVAADSTNLFWDNTNKRLGVGTASPNNPLDVRSSANDRDMLRVQSTAANGYSSIGFFNNSGTQKGGFGYGNASAIANLASRVYFYSTGSDLAFSRDQGSTICMLIQGSTGNLGVGITSPTAVIHLKSGTATASTAPLKFTSGTNLTTAEAGAVEYDGTHLFATPTGTLRERMMTGWGAGGTLTAGLTTTITDTRAKTTSTIFLQATSVAFTALAAYVSTKSNGSFVITTLSAAGTETFDYLIVN